jgi:hypothetical protein
MNDYLIQRPSVVTAASVLLYIFAGFGILGGLLLLGAGAAVGGLGVLALLLLGLSALYLVFATMILKGSNGARVATIVFLSISIFLNVINFDGTSVISIGLGLLVIGLLAWNRDAQEYFQANR